MIWNRVEAFLEYGLEKFFRSTVFKRKLVLKIGARRIVGRVQQYFEISSGTPVSCICNR